MAPVDLSTAQAAVDSALAEGERLRKTLGRNRDKQVRSDDERSIAKATALAWFGSHRKTLANAVDDVTLQAVDDHYNAILGATDRAAARSTYNEALKALRPLLSALRTTHLSAALAKGKPGPPNVPPSFAKLVPDATMQAALGRRWTECELCIEVGAPLAAIVMMGGLLEALLLARVNAEPNKASVFKAKNAPKEKGTTRPLKEWMLGSYLDVAHELAWITQSAKDVGVVLRDYRNYIHPYKELSHGTMLSKADAVMLWAVCRGIAEQLVR